MSDLGTCSICGIFIAHGAMHGHDTTSEILGILRDRVVKADATVAALTAENERMRQALIDVANYGYADTFIRDRALAALPSSRETTEPPPEKTREIL